MIMLWLVLIKTLFVSVCFANYFDLNELYNDNKAPSNIPLPIVVLPAMQELFKYKQRGEKLINGELYQNTYNMEPFNSLRKDRLNKIIIPFNTKIKKANTEKEKASITKEKSRTLDKFDKKNGLLKFDFDHRRRKDKKPCFFCQNKFETKHQYWMQYNIEAKTLYIYFIGTQNMKDLIADFNLDLEKFHFQGKEVLVHKGFYQILSSLIYGFLIADLDSILNQLKQEVKYIRIGGHSMGGALAQIFFLALFDENTLESWKLPPIIVNKKAPSYKRMIDGYEKIKQKMRAIRPKLPKDLHNYLVVTFGTPMIIYHTTIKNIGSDIQKRMINFITSKDPMVMMLGGNYNEDRNHKKFTFGDVMKMAFLAKPVIGTDQPIGEYYVLWPKKREKYRIKSLKGKYLKNHLGNGHTVLCEGNKPFWATKLVNFGLNFKRLTKAGFHNMYTYESILNSKEFEIFVGKYPKKLDVTKIKELNQILSLNIVERKEYYKKYYNDKTDKQSKLELGIIEKFCAIHGIKGDVRDVTSKSKISYVSIFNDATKFALIVFACVIGVGLFCGIFCGCCVSFAVNMRK